MQKSQGGLQASVKRVLGRVLRFCRAVRRDENLGNFNEDVTEIMQPKGIHLFRSFMEGATRKVRIDRFGGFV
jgi:hypothetical protein